MSVISYIHELLCSSELRGSVNAAGRGGVGGVCVVCAGAHVWCSGVEDALSQVAIELYLAWLRPTVTVLSYNKLRYDIIQFAIT